VPDRTRCVPCRARSIALSRNQPCEQKASMLHLKTSRALEQPWPLAMPAALTAYVDGPPKLERNLEAGVRT
jgi:hypothetical protein